MPDQAHTWEQLVGVAKETVFNTAVTPPTVSFPVTDFNISPQTAAIFDEARRSIASTTFDAVEGPGHSEFNFEGPVYPDLIGDFLNWIFGALDSVGASDPFVHTFSLGDPPSYTIAETVDQDDATGEIQVAGARLSQLSFSYTTGEGMLSFTAQGMGGRPTRAAIVIPAAAPADSPFPGWRGAVTSAGITGRVIGAEINIARDLEIVHTGEDDQDVKYVNRGPLGITGSLEVEMEDLSDFANALVSLRQSLVITFDDSANDRSIIFTMTDCHLNAQPLEMDRGNIGVRSRISFRAIHNATDAGEGTVAIENGVTTY